MTCCLSPGYPNKQPVGVYEGGVHVPTPVDFQQVADPFISVYFLLIFCATHSLFICKIMQRQSIISHNIRLNALPDKI